MQMSDETLVERYRNDPIFHAIVESFVAVCIQNKLRSQDIDGIATISKGVMREHLRCKTCRVSEGHIRYCPEAQETVSDKQIPGER